MRQNTGNSDTSADGRVVRFAAFVPAQPYQVDYSGRGALADARPARGDGDLSVAIIVSKLNCDHSVEECVLGSMNPGILHRVRGEDRPEVPVYADITLPSSMQSRHVEHALR
jgi:hypothetical protein